MSTLLVIGLAGLVLFLVFLLREARRFAGWILALAGLGVAGVFGYALFAQAAATRQVAQVAEVQAVSAGAALMLFLLALLLLLVLTIVGAVIALRWWQKHQEQQRFAETVKMLQMQALLNGSRMPAGVPNQMPFTPIIVVPQIPQAPWVVPSGQVGGYLSLPEDGDSPQGWPFYWG